MEEGRDVGGVLVAVAAAMVGTVRGCGCAVFPYLLNTTFKNEHWPWQGGEINTNENLLTALL